MAVTLGRVAEQRVQRQVVRLLVGRNDIPRHKQGPNIERPLTKATRHRLALGIKFQPSRFHSTPCATICDFCDLDCLHNALPSLKTAHQFQGNDASESLQVILSTSAWHFSGSLFDPSLLQPYLDENTVSLILLRQFFHNGDN